LLIRLVNEPAAEREGSDQLVLAGVDGAPLAEEA
jgi:hypothetical protein